MDALKPSISVAEYYAGKTLFITGATGFLGKALVEKLLRCCPGIKTIYILLRQKKRYDIQARMSDFINNKIFDILREESPNVLGKLKAVAGDIQEEKLGLSDEDVQLLQQECQIVFHSAASVRFDMFLKDAVNQNIAGTQRALTLAEGMNKLEIFVHVSTCYCRSDQKVLEEKLYPYKHDPHKLMDIISWMNDDLLHHLQPRLIAPEPNTYGYTKCITEGLVAKYNGKFPIVLARPSIVTAALKEPLPGWIDNLNGPTAIIVGCGKGVIRTMNVDANSMADIVPVDITINACILLAYLNGLERPKDIVVCNITNSQMNPITWGSALEIGRSMIMDYPFQQMFWYPDGGPTSSRIRYKIDSFISHTIPAYLVDLLLCLVGIKTFMVRVQQKVTTGLEVLDHYAKRSWCFSNTYFVSLKDRVSEDDNKTFFTDIHEIQWPEYLKNYILGAREYCCKEDPASLPKARIMFRRYYYAHKVLKILQLLFVTYVLYIIYRIL